jgi:hypothetical protein
VLHGSFDQCWTAIKPNLVRGQVVTHWSQSGRARGAFNVLEVGADSIRVLLKNGSARNVLKSDFEYMFDRWPDYTTGKKRRDEVNRSQNSTYTISILRWVSGI